LLKGIGVGSLAKFEENIGPLLGGHSSSGTCARGIGFLEAPEDADLFLHASILRTDSKLVSKAAGIKVFFDRWRRRSWLSWLC
jgi:cold shock CspA family protein